MDKATVNHTLTHSQPDACLHLSFRLSTNCVKLTWYARRAVVLSRQTCDLTESQTPPSAVALLVGGS